MIEELYEKTFGVMPDRVEPIGKSGGGGRRYYVMDAKDGKRVYGVLGNNPEENRAFCTMAGLLRKRGLRVPEVYGISDDGMCYLQQDLGTLTLSDFLFHHRTAEGYDTEAADMLRKVVRELPDIQFKGAGDDVFSNCYPMPEMDARSILFDLNYFKYCFLKLHPVEFNEIRLEDDLQRLKNDILTFQSDTFLYRDFQARNVMVVDDTPYYIDFQGGRKGPIYYDLASLLWQASAMYSDELKDAMICEYLDALKLYMVIDKKEFVSNLRIFVLFRTLQVLGAYGYRGLWEKKKHFIDSIPYGMDNARKLMESELGERYPYLKEILTDLSVQHPLPSDTVSKAVSYIAGDTAYLNTSETMIPLVVDVWSFSFKKGIPVDESGNGGGYVFDCRGTHNPGRYDEYKQLTGLDQPVIDFLEEDGEILSFLDNCYRLVDFHVQRFMERGFTHLMICCGCTGGRHRSVYSAQHIAEHIHGKYGIEVHVHHREQGIETAYKRS